MRKGFTLIELLAVIVILAIIALIATPIVLNIIEDAKESATLRSAEFYLDGVEQSIATATLKNATVNDGAYSIMEDGNICIGKLEDSLCKKDESIQGSGYVLEVNVNGEKPKSGTIKIKNGQIQKVDLKLSEKEVWTDPFTGDLAYKLAPGLYDENDKLLISWEDLISKEYRTITFYEYVLDEETWEEYEVEVSSAILNVDENGILSTAFGSSNGRNYSAEYLTGKLVIDESVTSFGESAFDGCTNLTSITIPGSVTSIGDVFSGCTSLTNVIIEEGVTSIGESAFYACESLTSIAIPGSVTSIGDMAFYGCTSLTSITIPSSVTSIGVLAFSGCTSLANVIIEEGVTSIGDDAFNGCESLTSIAIPGSVTSIGMLAFYGCTSLTSITISEGVTSIGESAFHGCESLTSITIPSSVTSIESYAFWGCTSISSIKVDKNNPVYDSRDNSNAIIEKATNKIISSCKNTTIPSSVTIIGAGSFSGDTSLTELTLPSNIIEIEINAFQGCTSLTSITIPSSVTEIGWGAFYGCTSLTSITIPNSVTSIGDKAFFDCESLTTIYYNGTATGKPWGAPSTTKVIRDF